MDGSVDGVGLASDWTCARGRDKEGELRRNSELKFTPLLPSSVSTMETGIVIFKILEDKGVQQQ